ncbi:unnamed protein product [Orchesella dallaii]|uniref:Uncharacterized protein n=1 Tax=Orchesella dallaii TaxID=48710 RepID=A0ABP1RT91_9HEXA
MLQSDKIISEWSSTAFTIKQSRLHLETKLSVILETNLDINPYTNRICMDFFVLPRPSHKISAYAIRSKELDNLIEYNNENGTLLTNGVEPSKLFQWHGKNEENSKCILRFYQTLLNLKAEVQEYPVGVESKALVKKFRQKWEYDDSKPLFGKYSDEEGIISLPDVFYPQNLGKDKNVILLPSLYEGPIVTPSEILLSIWIRICFK